MSNHIWKHIGLIGGLGPRASSYFYRLLVDICSENYGAVYDHDYPDILSLSLNSDLVSPAGEINRLKLLSQFNQAFVMLDNYGIDVIAIPCNSIFIYYNEFPKINNIEVINLPEAIANVALKRSSTNVLLLCSRGLRVSKGYDNYFTSKNININYPNEKHQRMIDEFIYGVMKGTTLLELSASFFEFLELLSANQIEIIIGCTELSVLLGNMKSIPDNVIDSCRVLADETLKTAYIGPQTL